MVDLLLFQFTLLVPVLHQSRTHFSHRLNDKLIIAVNYHTTIIMYAVAKFIQKKWKSAKQNRQLSFVLWLICGWKITFNITSCRWHWTCDLFIRKTYFIFKCCSEWDNCVGIIHGFACIGFHDVNVNFRKLVIIVRRSYGVFHVLKYPKKFLISSTLN